MYNAFLELSPKKDDIYTTSPASPLRIEDLVVPDTPEEVYSTYKRSLGVGCPQSFGDQLLATIDPSLHELFKCLLPIAFETPCSRNLAGFSNTRAYEGGIRKIKFPKIKDEKNATGQ